MRPFPCGHPRTDANTRLKRKHPKPSPRPQLRGSHELVLSGQRKTRYAPNCV